MRPIDGDAIEKDWYTELHSNYKDEYAKGFRAGLMAAVSYPTIDAYGTWIPCSERLPVLDDSDGGVKQSDICLCAIKWNDGEITEETGWYNSSGLWNYDSTDCKVIAWMPLPLSYRGEER